MGATNANKRTNRIYILTKTKSSIDPPPLDLRRFELATFQWSRPVSPTTGALHDEPPDGWVTLCMSDRPSSTT